ncbi:condensation domain-containing protein [Umezawaea endophytica]|uniref:Condensation domain-containing protein n=1 Tax=Umezawaea endophytica TaxID=1654476 RepID=A0A9X2VVH0_9PSEU|nr:condensation domain-containing protein [Umezawaea endophytica]MCS7483588.1 condensation domain-containing protein [Umezawaea endophytica]
MLSTWPASVFQYTLMTTHQLLPSGSIGPHMTMSTSVLISGTLDVDALDGAYDDFVARNDVLRTVLEREGESWVQKVHPHRTAHLKRRTGSADRAQEFADDWSREPVPVDEPPLVRGQVVGLDDGTHLVSLVFHHLHTDPPSLDLAMAELGVLYAARLAGERIPAPPLQFGPYVRQCVEKVAGRLDADREFWRTTVEGARPVSPAPGLERDWSRPPSSGVLRLDVLDGDRAAELEKWALRHRTTLFSTLFTGFCLAMADRSVTRDLLVATVFEQRDHPDTRALVGPFLHPSLLRVRVPDGADWDVLTPVVRDVVRDAYDRAHIPTIDILGMHPDVLHAVATEPVGLCLFQYLPSSGIGAEIPFGPANGRLLANTDVGPTGDVGLMFRLHRKASGDLVATVTFDRRGLDEPLVRELFDDFVRRVTEPVASVVR